MNAQTPSPSNLADSNEHFAFGKNWQRFIARLNDDHIREAENSLKDMLAVDNLEGKHFLDIGSGSGLFSLAARNLGARVHSFDYDPESVACTQELRQRYLPDDAAWTIEQGSVLNTAYLRSLGPFDVVYSWGVLHCTGDLWQGLTNADLTVKPGGLLFLAIYNDRGIASQYWRVIKRAYNRLPVPLRMPFVLLVQLPREIKAILVSLLLLKPGRYLRTFTQYNTKRGMSRWHDIVDWVGGYPYEVAKPDAVFDFYRTRGYTLRRLTTNPGLGCNQFVFEKTTDRTIDSH